MANFLQIRNGLQTPVLDHRSLAAETVTRTIYIDPAGSDTTGTGLVGAPFFSIHRAFEDIKPVVNNVEIKIYANDGTYDFSTMSNLFIDKVFLGANGFITIIPTSGVSTPLSAFTTLSSGTFTSYSNNTHTIAPDPSWVVDTYKNKFIEVTSMISGGALPTLGTFYTFRIMPIYKNTSDTIHCGYTGSSGTQALDFKDYNIVEHKVKFNFGTKFIFTRASGPQRCVRFQFLEINCNGIYMTDSEDKASINAPYLFFTNSMVVAPAFRGTSYYGYNTYFRVSDFHTCLSTGYNNIHEQAYYSSSASYPAAFYVGAQAAGKITNQIINQTSATKRPGVSVFSTNNVDCNFTGYLKFVNCTSGVYLERDGLFFSSVNISHDTCGFTVYINGSSRIVNVGTLTFVNEPTTARLTLNGTTAAIKYYDTELEINALAIAPDAYKYIAMDPYSNVDIDTGTEVVNSFPKTVGHKACRWDYALDNGSGTNMRSGLLIAVWNTAGTIKLSEVATADIGETEGAVFSAAINGDNVELRLTVDSDNWSGYVNRHII